MALSTACFTELFNSMWEILNIKTLRKGWEKRIKYAVPFRSSNFNSDLRVNEINEFINWLVKWESNDWDSNGKLTSETSHALIFTFKSLLSFFDILFNKPETFGLDNKERYFLTGKLQTDILEKRFGTYRQLNGASYLMSFKQVISAERKIRIRTKIKLGNIKYNLLISNIMTKMTIVIMKRET